MLIVLAVSLSVRCQSVSRVGKGWACNVARRLEGWQGSRDGQMCRNRCGGVGGVDDDSYPPPVDVCV